MKRKVIPLMLVLLLSLSVLSSCSTPSSGENSEVVTYLEAVGPDFEKSKDDLEVFDMDFGDNDEGIIKALELVKGGKADFEKRMNSAKGQKVPGGSKDIEAFHNALISYYTDSLRLMDEFEQVLGYAQGIYKSIKPLEQLMGENFDNASSMEDVVAVIQALKTSIGQSVEIAEKCSPPQYMADSHNNYLNALKSFDSATDDFVYALQLQDPLRANATSYRYELLSNKLQYVGSEMSKDIEAQQKSMDELGKRLKNNQELLEKQLGIWQEQFKIAG